MGAVTSGLLLWLAFPGHDLWWCAPLAVAVLSMTLTQVRTRVGAGLGFLAGMAFFVPTLSWSGVYVGPVPWIALAVLQALYFALYGALTARFSRHRPAVLMGAASWVLAEWLRSTTPFGGFPWVRLAFSQADAVWAPIIAWVSAPGLTFLVAALGGALAAIAWQVAQLVRDRRRGLRTAKFGAVDSDEQAGSSAAGRMSRTSRVTRPSLPRLALTCAVPVIALLLGSVLTPPTDGRQIKVAGVQGNVPTAGLGFNAQREAVLRNHVAGTQELASRIHGGRTPRPDVVVWPENASDIDPIRDAGAESLITDAVRAVGAPVIVGAVLSEPAPKVSNSALLYQPGRGITDRYVKQHPVPFGEYIPYRSFFRTFSKQVDLVRADFVQGQRVGLFTIPTQHGDAKLAPIICFEVAYDDLLRKPARQGAQLFAVQTNNATFGYTDESTQQLAISRLRALEYGRSVVHISTVGVSGLITPDGRVHDRSELFTHDVLTGQLPLRSNVTWAQRMGRAPEIACALAVAAALVWTWRRRTSR